MSNDNGESGASVEKHKCTVVTVVYDHQTCIVTLGLDNVTIGLAQMMIDEARRQLDIMRRQAAAQEMMQQRASAEQTQKILDDIRNKR